MFKYIYILFLVSLKKKWPLYNVTVVFGFYTCMYRLHVLQEPGTNEEIKKFATEKYGVKFDMFAKIDVNKDSADPLWKYLKSKQGGTLGE